MVSFLAKLIYNIVVFSPFLLVALVMESCFGYCLYGALVLCHFPSLFRSSKIPGFVYIEKRSHKVISYLINLNNATERLEHVFPLIQRLNFPVQRIVAVDGNELSDDYISSITDEVSYLKFFRMMPENGTIGCALSHLNTWKEFLKSDNEFALICEDDIKFSPDKLSEAVNELVKNRDMWDIVTFEALHDGYPRKVLDLGENKRLVVYITNVSHSGCYLINRRTAYKLIEKFYPIKLPVDHYFVSAWEFGITLLGVEPRLVKQTGRKSQIKTEESKKINTRRLRFYNAKFNIQRAIIQTIYNSLVYAKFLWKDFRLIK